MPYAQVLWGVFILIGITALFSDNPTYSNYASSTGTIECHNPYIVDGDTLKCDGVRIRLAGIDAPEMNGKCREGRTCVSGDPDASKDYLYEISRGDITCHPIENDHYGRTVAQCDSDYGDLSCTMLSSGHAEQRYGSISCS